MKLKAFSKFENTREALSAATLIIDSKPSKGLRKFLRVHCEGEALAVADSKLGNAIKEKLVRNFCFLLDHISPFGCIFAVHFKLILESPLFFFFCV